MRSSGGVTTSVVGEDAGGSLQRRKMTRMASDKFLPEQNYINTASSKNITKKSPSNNINEERATQRDIKNSEEQVEQEEEDRLPKNYRGHKINVERGISFSANRTSISPSLLPKLLHPGNSNNGCTSTTRQTTSSGCSILNSSMNATRQSRRDERRLIAEPLRHISPVLLNNRGLTFLRSCVLFRI